MYRVLLIGLGQISQGYDFDKNANEAILTHAQAIYNDSRFELVAGIDLDVGKREMFENKFGRPTFEKISSIPRNLLVDIVVVATPTATHTSTIEQILSCLNPKAILCEKPLSYSHTEAVKLVKKCKLMNVKLFINYIRRTEPSIQHLRTLLSKDTFNSPFHGICWYSHGLYNSASHFCDLFCYLFGAPHRATIDLINKPEYQDSDFKIDFTLRFMDGLIHFKTLPNAQLFYNRFEIFFNDNYLYYNTNGDIQYFQADPTTDNVDRKYLLKKGTKIESEMRFYQKTVYNDLFVAMRGDKHHLSTGESELQISKLFDSLKNESGLI